MMRNSSKEMLKYEVYDIFTLAVKQSVNFNFVHILVRPKKNTLVCGNADDEKNLHPDSRKKFFLSI